MRVHGRVGLVTAVLGLAVAAVPHTAQACGGFFCSRVPVDQSGENIVFGIRGNRVEAHVQIQYQGDAERFAWVVPLHAKPTLEVGSPQLFQFLAQATQPQFQLEWSSACNNGWVSSPGRAEDWNGGMPTQDGGATPPVTVVSREEVGPYDAAVLQATDAQALKTWLVDNGYDLSAVGEELLAPYVGEGSYFVALKLLKNRSTGELRPIVLTTEGTTPCIPIRLTAIAARPDMPIRAYVLSERRAVPQNYRHVLVNPTRIDWLSRGSNYAQVATQAVDEAGGRAFLTEFAGPAAPLAQGFTVPAFDTARLAQLTHPVDFFRDVQGQGFPADGTLLSLLSKYIPMPQALADRGVTAQDFYNQLWNYRADIDADPHRAPFDAAGFAAALEEAVVVPWRRADALLDAHPYLTRLFTTMSAHEMTEDPEFDFNPDAPDVSSVFRAKAREETCEQDWSKRRVRVELPDGTYFFVTNGQRAFPDGPGALRIEEYGSKGPPMVLVDNTPQVLAAVEKAGGGQGPGCAGGCGASGAGSGLALLTLATRALLRRRHPASARRSR